MSGLWWLPVVAIPVLVLVGYLLRPRRKAMRLTEARRGFHAQRERLEAQFVRIASARSDAEAARWADCNFADDVAYVRNRTTGELSAFVAVTVAAEEPDRSRFEASDAVGNLQAGTAVFRLDRDHWTTEGRAILNLSPIEAVAFYHSDLEIVGEELAHRW